MRNFRFLSLILAFILISISINAQKGIIRGAVVDESNGEALISVTIVAEGTIVGITTDLDGKFNLSIEPGTYNLRRT